jgi:2-C-methyl-D-erythritol 4-phosphate cytidylyltransferase
MSRLAVVLVTANPPGMSGDGGAFAKIDGRESLLRCVELFVNREGVEQVIVTVSNDKLDDAKKKYAAHFGLSGVKLVPAGAKWSEQLKAAAELVSADATHVIVHDAARPAVPFGDIDALIEAAEKHDAVTLVAPLRQSLLELDEGNQPIGYERPSRYVALLTPQAFTRAAFVALANSGSELHASKWTLVNGSSLNIRLGTSGDEKLVKAMLSMLPKPKVRGPLSPFEEAQW